MFNEIIDINALKAIKASLEKKLVDLADRTREEKHYFEEMSRLLQGDDEEYCLKHVPPYCCYDPYDLSTYRNNWRFFEWQYKEKVSNKDSCEKIIHALNAKLDEIKLNGISINQDFIVNECNILSEIASLKCSIEGNHIDCERILLGKRIADEYKVAQMQFRGFGYDKEQAREKFMQRWTSQFKICDQRDAEAYRCFISFI